MKLFRTNSHRGKSGFTLLELMVVVTIVGVLAAVAVPTYSRHILRSKTSEALTNLRKIYDGQVAYYHEERTGSDGKILSRGFVYCMPTPPHPPTKKKRFGVFNAWGWPEIKFQTDGPVYYVYMAEAFPAPPHQPGVFPGVPGLPPIPPNIVAGFAARAQGDLDGDGNWSLYERLAGIDGETGEFQAPHGVYILDPDE